MPSLSRRRFWPLLALPLALAAAGGVPPCPCDCDGDGSVAVAELISAVRISLGEQDVAACRPADTNGNGAVAINELIQGINAALLGCDAPTPVPATPTATPDPQMPPTDGDSLLPWLQAGIYRSWRNEAFIHESRGPHLGRVQTFINDLLYDSLIFSFPWDHAPGSAAVKELYGGSGDEVRGWAVSVKLDDDSDGGNGWYWYERFGTAVFADGRGVSICTNCHGDVSNRDFYLSTFPVVECAEPDRPHDVCGNLLTPGLACAYDGRMMLGSQEQSASAYLRPGPYLFIERDTYYARGVTDPLSSEGDFDQRLCVSDFPRVVQGSLSLAEDASLLTFRRYSDDGAVLMFFTGRRRE